MEKQRQSTHEKGESVAYYLKKIKDITRDIPCVYRGQSDAGWPLESGMARHIIRLATSFSTSSKQSVIQPIKSALERDYKLLLPDSLVDYHNKLLAEARQKGFGLADGRSLSDLELLTELQHFGAVTCMLDFTENPLVGLYFACRGNDCQDGAVFCVPHSNISTAPEGGEISELLQSGGPHQWRPIMRGAAERRIIRQDGLFLINLPGDVNGLERITIQAADKEEILKELKNTYQISAEKLFIDLSGFAQNQASGREWKEYWARLYSGNEEVLKGGHEAAIAEYDEAIRLEPDYAVAYYSRGNAKALLWQPEAAIVDYDKAIRLKPSYAEAHYNRGNTKDELGQPEAAIADYTKAIGLKPDLAVAYTNRGNARASLGQYEAAIADYNEAIGLKPDEAEVYNNRGNTKDFLGQPEAAIVDYDEAIRLKPDDAVAYHNRGNTKVALGQPEAAIVDYDEAIRLKPDDARVYNNRGNAKADLGQYEAAIADYDEAIRLKSDDADVYNDRGVAKRYLEQYEVIGPKLDDADVYNNRGIAKRNLGQPEAAIADLQKALGLAEEQNLSALVAKIREILDKLNASDD